MGRQQDPFPDDETVSLVRRYERMLKRKEHFFFDVEEFEEIIDYYLHKNLLNKTRQTIRHALLQHPRNTSILLRKAMYLISSDKAQEALALLQDIRSLAAGSYELYMTQGTAYSRLGKYEEAVKHYKHAVKYGSPEEKVDAYIQIAYEYEGMGDYAKAIAFLKWALQDDPERDYLLDDISMAYEVGDMQEEAVTFFTEYTDKNPFSAPAWFCLGIAYHGIRQFDKSIMAYDYALALDETFVSAYFGKANAYTATEDYHKAISVYREALPHTTYEPLTYYYIGECYQNLEDYNKAIDYFMKSIRIDELFEDAWSNIGISYQEMGKFRESLPFLKKASELNPSNTLALFELADSYYELDKYDEAEDLYNKVVELEPGNVQAYLDLSHLYAVRDRFEEAIRIIQDGIAIVGEDASLYYRLTVYLIKALKVKQAMEALETALSINYLLHFQLWEYYPDILQFPEFPALIERKQQNRDKL
ncbi:MAG: tetratricopeptide repeat protein [Bacteroidetes bacterium]|nr:tetratricopeptide repeat protein [Bacteroidota bacterium]